MKKIAAGLLAILMTVLLAACSGSGSGDSAEGTEPTAAESRTLADDADVMGMSFTPPLVYLSIRRYVSAETSGKIIEKDIDYTFEDGGKLSYSVMSGHQLSEIMNPDEMESRTAGGETFYLKPAGIYLYAFAQRGDLVYALIDKDASSEHPRLEKALQTLSFSDTAETAMNENPEDLYAVRYTLDSTWNTVSTESAVEADQTNRVTFKGCGWSFGEDAGHVGFCFKIYVYKDQTLETVLSADKEYTDQEVNGVSYRVESALDATRYYTEYGSDVYCIVNNGVSNGYFAFVREDSAEPFRAFLNSVHFE